MFLYILLFIGGESREPETGESSEPQSEESCEPGTGESSELFSLFNGELSGR